MPWENLFDDLEGQLVRERSAEETDVAVEEERLRLARLSLRERLIALSDGHGGRTILRISLSGGQNVTVVPSAFGRDWFSADLVDESSRSRRCLVPLAAIAQVVMDVAQVPSSLGSDRSPRMTDQPRGFPVGEQNSLSARLGLPFVLRDLCRRRAAIEVVTVSGRCHGTIDRVGRDHFDLAEHEHGVPRRSSVVTGYRIVPMAQLSLVLL